MADLTASNLRREGKVPLIGIRQLLAKEQQLRGLST